MSTSKDFDPAAFSAPNVWTYDYVCKCGMSYSIMSFSDKHSFTLICPDCQRTAEQLCRPHRFYTK